MGQGDVRVAGQGQRGGSKRASEDIEAPQSKKVRWADQEQLVMPTHGEISPQTQSCGSSPATEDAGDGVCEDTARDIITRCLNDIALGVEERHVKEVVFERGCDAHKGKVQVRKLTVVNIDEETEGVHVGAMNGLDGLRDEQTVDIRYLPSEEFSESLDAQKNLPPTSSTATTFTQGAPDNDHNSNAGHSGSSQNGELGKTEQTTASQVRKMQVEKQVREDVDEESAFLLVGSTTYVDGVRDEQTAPLTATGADVPHFPSEEFSESLDAQTSLLPPSSSTQGSSDRCYNSDADDSGKSQNGKQGEAELNTASVFQGGESCAPQHVPGQMDLSSISNASQDDDQLLGTLDPAGPGPDRDEWSLFLSFAPDESPCRSRTSQQDDTAQGDGSCYATLDNTQLGTQDDEISKQGELSPPSADDDGVPMRCQMRSEARRDSIIAPQQVEGYPPSLNEMGEQLRSTEATDELRNAKNAVLVLQNELKAERRRRSLLTTALSEQAEADTRTALARMRDAFEAQVAEERQRAALEVEGHFTQVCRECVSEVTAECEAEIYAKSDELRKQWKRQKSCVEDVVRSNFGDNQELLVLSQAIKDEVSSTQQERMESLRLEVSADLRMQLEDMKVELRKELEGEFELDKEKAVLLCESRLETECETLREQLAMAKSTQKAAEGERCTIQTKLRVAEEQLAAAQVELMACQVHLKEARVENEALHSQAIAGPTLQKDLESAQESLSAARLESAKLHETNSRLSRDLQSAHQELSCISAETRQLRAEVLANSSLRKEYAGAKSGFIAAQSQTASLQQKLAASMEETRNLRQELAKMKRAASLIAAHNSTSGENAVCLPCVSSAPVAGGHGGTGSYQQPRAPSAGSQILPNAAAGSAVYRSAGHAPPHTQLQNVQHQRQVSNPSHPQRYHQPQQGCTAPSAKNHPAVKNPYQRL